jgi:hypothetical protein
MHQRFNTGCARVWGRPRVACRASSVHHRLYTSAQDKHTRLELRKQMEEAEEDEQLRKSRASMSWISAKLMQGRGANDMYDNYGEMLYAEGIELHHARLKKVGGRGRRRACGVPWHGVAADGPNAACGRPLSSVTAPGCACLPAMQWLQWSSPPGCGVAWCAERGRVS